MILCPTRACFGIDCPLCGGLRMAGSLARGDLPAALHYNAVALGFLLLCLWSVTRSARLAALKVITERAVWIRYRGGRAPDSFSDMPWEGAPCRHDRGGAQTREKNSAWVVGRRRGVPVRTWQHWRWTPVVSGVVFVAWFVARNLPFAPFTGLFV
ncbi:DUF2752 domain-containing protein [Amycolatopsis pigmentata]|uniref:DUF2752 domain-containing protein n=1 Tax=Amycolatopsis pigmentata TaxID=450801 RepID=A0ABW5G0B5_9PSEU